MKILAVSDTVMPPLENAANLRRRYNDVDVVVSCGDMPAAYLDYITTILGVPLLYVRGNHDERYIEEPPGGVDLHRHIFEYKGISFVGLEGCIKYNRGKIQYTQAEMQVMVMKMASRMQVHRLQKRRRADIFVAHSPARGIHDVEDDYPHRGFDAFLRFIKWYRPRYMLHGHVHTWDRRKTIKSTYEDTCILNINPYTVLEIDPVN